MSHEWSPPYPLHSRCDCDFRIFQTSVRTGYSLIKSTLMNWRRGATGLLFWCICHGSFGLVGSWTHRGSISVGLFILKLGGIIHFWSVETIKLAQTTINIWRTLNISILKDRGTDILEIPPVNIPDSLRRHMRRVHCCHLRRSVTPNCFWEGGHKP